MAFISEWPLAVLFVIAAADAEAGILTAVLFAAARVTGVAEAAAAAALGTLLTNGLIFLVALRRNANPLCNRREGSGDDKIEFWLGKYGLIGTALLLRAAFSRRWSGPAAFARLTAGRTGAAAAFALGVTVWTVGWTCLLAPAAVLAIDEMSALTRVRMTLPGFTLLAVLAATVLRTALIRTYERMRENK